VTICEDQQRDPNPVFCAQKRKICESDSPEHRILEGGSKDRDDHAQPVDRQDSPASESKLAQRQMRFVVATGETPMLNCNFFRLVVRPWSLPVSMGHRSPAWLARANRIRSSKLNRRSSKMAQFAPDTSEEVLRTPFKCQHRCQHSYRSSFVHDHNSCSRT